jgi:N-hydroxyarylamine O-acetyltransferase
MSQHMNQKIDLELYCQRISYGGERTATLSTLQQLLALHTQAIAFDNLSSLAGEVVSIEPQAIEQKLLREGRGGYCFEHNTLLWNVLRQLDFTVSGLAARVRWNVQNEVVTPIGHMLLQVILDNKPYLADVGFGGLTLTAALRLDVESAQQTTHELFRITRSDDTHTLQAMLGETWQSLYSFQLHTYQPVDYAVWNWFTCTAPQSPFVHNLMLARPDALGRHALNNNRYTFRSLSGEVATQYLTSVDALHSVLREQFLIRVPDYQAVHDKLGDIAAMPTHGKPD